MKLFVSRHDQFVICVISTDMVAIIPENKWARAKNGLSNVCVSLLQLRCDRLIFTPTCGCFAVNKCRPLFNQSQKCHRLGHGISIVFAMICHFPQSRHTVYSGARNFAANFSRFLPTAAPFTATCKRKSPQKCGKKTISKRIMSG